MNWQVAKLLEFVKWLIFVKKTFMRTKKYYPLMSKGNMEKTKKSPSAKGDVSALGRGKNTVSKGKNVEIGGKSGGGCSVKIVANFDAGFGNYLYIRGDGDELSWDRGTKMTPIDDNHWQWESRNTYAKPHFEFKVLVNDEVWSSGENCLATEEKNVIVPTFS
jgi:hypothetical protein